MSNGRYFSANEAISMTPFIISYCRSLYYVIKREERRAQILFTLNGLISMDPKKIRKIKRIINKISIRSLNDVKKTSEWVIEINKMGWEICKSLSHIDIPVWDEDIQKVVYLCFNKDTKIDSIWWHNTDEDGQKVRPYFYKKAENKPVKRRKMPQ